MTPSVLYLVHDLDDPAVRRRVLMLKAGGAGVALAGFRRTPSPVISTEDQKIIDLGLTRNGAFAHRATKTLLSAGNLVRKLDGLEADIIIARNLEMLFLARQVSRRFKVAPVIVYESLDIHRLLLRKDFVGNLLRGAERDLLKQTAMVVTSSPAFVDNYFTPMQGLKLPVYLLENKVLDTGSMAAVVARRKTAGDGVYRIGWFGALRCAKSLALLSAFTLAMNGKVQVILRGKPAYNEFDDFDANIAREPYMSFGGAYSAEDLPRLYGEVDFSWAIDFFEEGQNSKWLLPNRLYEGSKYGSIPIAMEGTQTATYVRAHNIGLILNEATPEALMDLFAGLDTGRLKGFAAALETCPPSMFAATVADCAGFVDRLKQLKAGVHA